jgi:hypothetical protein
MILVVESCAECWNHAMPLVIVSQLSGCNLQSTKPSSNYNSFNHCSDWSSDICVTTAILRLRTTNYNGINASFPYINHNDICLVNLLQFIQYAHNIAITCWFQSSHCMFHTFVNACSSILLNPSMVPSAYG